MLIVITTVCYSCVDGSVDSVKQVTNDASCKLDQEMSALLELHNKSRRDGKACGQGGRRTSSRLIWSCALTKVAAQHTQYMLNSNSLVHKSAQGWGLAKRVDQSGYRWRAAAENISHGYRDVQAVMNGWLKSEEHCANLMSAEYSELGAARHGDYWSVIFALPEQ